MVALAKSSFTSLAQPPLRSTTSPEPMPADIEPPFMRLVRDEAAPADSAPIGRIGPDRRCFPRRHISLRVGGRRLDHTVPARREPFLNFQMKDVSIGGLAATSQTALTVGERVAVFFPPEGTSRGWDAYGRILRVEPQKSGYRVAVAFDPMPAA